MPYSLISKVNNNIKYLFKHKLLPRSFLARSITILIVPIFLVNIILSIIFYDNHWGIIGRRMAQGIAGDIEAVISLLDTFSDFKDQDKLLKVAANSMNLKVTVIKDMKITRNMERTERNWITKEIKKTLNSNLRSRNSFYIDEITNKPDIVVYLQFYSNVLRIEIPQKRFFSSTAYVFVMWMLVTSFLLFGIAAIFLKNQVRSLRKLATAADEFGKGREINFKIGGATEIKRAGRAFVNMKNRIKKQMSERTYMLAGVSHDLRTPLTRMNLQLAMLEDKNTDLVEGLKQDVKVMEKMIDAYITFVKGDGAEPYTLVDLDELLREIVDRFRVSNSNIDLIINNRIKMNLRHNAILRCFSNIISNAVRYADKTAITLELEDDKYAVISIDDDGPGIEEAKFEEVFRAFYRIEDSRNLKTGGIGLGLTVSRDIVNAHGGDIILGNSYLGGLQVVIKLPL